MTALPVFCFHEEKIRHVS